MAELKLCPFCGRTPMVDDCGEHRYFVRCECGINQDHLYAQKCDAVRAWNRRTMPPQPTIHGYNIEHLVLIAKVMEKENVTPEKAVEAFTDIVRVVQMIADEQKEIIRKAVEEWQT